MQFSRGQVKTNAYEREPGEEDLDSRNSDLLMSLDRGNIPVIR